jgi:hypothetical protein
MDEMQGGGARRVSHGSLVEEKSRREEKLGLGGGHRFLKGVAAWSSRGGGVGPSAATRRQGRRGRGPRPRSVTGG